MRAPPAGSRPQTSAVLISPRAPTVSSLVLSCALNPIANPSIIMRAFLMVPPLYFPSTPLLPSPLPSLLVYHPQCRNAAPRLEPSVPLTAYTCRAPPSQSKPHPEPPALVGPAHPSCAGTTNISLPRTTLSYLFPSVTKWLIPIIGLFPVFPPEVLVGTLVSPILTL